MNRGEAYCGVAQRVEQSEAYGDGVQVITFEDGRRLHLPPIEYTVKPGDRFVMETAPGECEQGVELWRISINDEPLNPRPLWDRYYLTHPRPWLGEYVQDGQIVRFHNMAMKGGR